MSAKTKETNENKINKKTSKNNITKINSKTNSKKSNVNTNKTKSTKKAKVNTKSPVNKKERKLSNKLKIQKQKTSTNIRKKGLKTKQPAEIVEYYDLPYRYNETIVKILYQTPNTLFVYWDIADSDRENYIKQYGENFFNITRPVLIIHNDTMHYSFEIPINDFANSWYLHINDSKCSYRIELGRRPNYYNAEVTKEIQEKIHTDYIYVSTSNEIESPNDHVLFNTNKNNTIKVRNVKNHNEKSISLYEIIKHLPAMKRVQNIPYISEELLKDMYSGIYQNEDISLFDRITNNPSSGGNPSSGSMSSRMF